MPTRVFRRTPESEKAAIYGYKDLLKDSISLLQEKAAANVARMTSGGMSGEELAEIGLAGIGAGTKIARGLGKGKFPFSLKTTDIPFWDSVLKKPAYHKEAKGIERKIEFMSPKEYLWRNDKFLSQEKPTDWRHSSMIDPKKVEEYTQAMRRGAKFPMPALQYKGSFAQEGRHRMLAAQKLGIDRVPVLVMKATPEQKLMERFSKEGLHYDAFTEPLPGYGYHQWTLYGEGPAKGATFGTKTTSTEEMTEKISELLRKFSR